MRKCIQYAVICNSDPSVLVKLVSEEILNGMEPLGGTSVTVAYVANPQDDQLFSREQILCQAMARWKEVPNKMAPGLMDYEIVSELGADEFDGKATVLIRKGFSPVGEIGISDEKDSVRITQGFSKPKPEEIKKIVGKVVQA